MDVKVGDRWEGLVQSLVESGRYASADDVLSAGLRLIQEQKAKLEWLRHQIAAAIEEDGSRTDEDVAQAVEARLSQLRLNDEAA